MCQRKTIKSFNSVSDLQNDKKAPPKLAVKNCSIPLCLNQSFGFLEPFNPRVPKTARQRIQSGFAALKITDGGKKCGSFSSTLHHH